MSMRARFAGWTMAALAALGWAACGRAQEGATPGSASSGEPVESIGRGLGSSPLEPAARPPKTDLPNGGLTFLPELKPTDGVPTLAPGSGGDAAVARMADALGQKPVLIDQAVAVINGRVILASDIKEQQRLAIFMPLTSPGAELTPMRAMEQIVNRTLLEDQMDEQQLVPPPSDKDVDTQIAELRANLPACAGHHCETEQGWQSFLAAHGVTESQLVARWKEEMAILDFIGARFRTGIRITQPEIEAYYKNQLVPEFDKRHLRPPPLSMVSGRIEQVLLQQHVNALLGDYLRSLKDAGNVRILDPAYSSLGKKPDAGASPDAGDSTPDGGDATPDGGDAAGRPGGTP